MKDYFANSETYLRLGERLFRGDPFKRISKREVEQFMLFPEALLAEQCSSAIRLPKDCWSEQGGKLLDFSLNTQGDLCLVIATTKGVFAEMNEARYGFPAARYNPPLTNATILGFRGAQQQEPVVVLNRVSQSLLERDQIYIGGKRLFQGCLHDHSHGTQMLSDGSLICQAESTANAKQGKRVIYREGSEIIAEGNIYYTEYALTEDKRLVGIDNTHSPLAFYVANHKKVTSEQVEHLGEHNGVVWLISHNRILRLEEGYVVDEMSILPSSSYTRGFGLLNGQARWVERSKDDLERWVVGQQTTSTSFQKVSTILTVADGVYRFWGWTGNKHLFEMELEIQSRRYTPASRIN